ncbi:MAG: heavy-metal-associated domain-containing protein [Nanoarchaeota archaeon]|jgi:copper chaperone CopZ|nr:heavy-metal-associated domain-containing protein [Nanoarchaeota archaeon]
MKRTKIEISGMTCPHCEGRVEKELRLLGAKNIKVSHVDKSAVFSVDDKINEDVLKRAVKTAGYEPGKVFFKEEEKKGFFGKLIG